LFAVCRENSLGTVKSIVETLYCFIRLAFYLRHPIFIEYFFLSISSHYFGILTAVTAAAAIASWFFTGEPAHNNRRRTSNARVDFNRFNRTVQGAGPALHA